MNNIKKSIGWADWSWNPITGCLNMCQYCYARRIYERFHKTFTPQLHKDRLSQPIAITKPSKIFVCSVSDFWGDGVLRDWREQVYNTIRACPQHTFQILTRQPQNISQEEYKDIPENVWLGGTVTNIYESNKIAQLSVLGDKNLIFASCEPLLGEMGVYLYLAKWIIIGAMTGAGSKKYAPKKEWIREIVRQADKLEIPVFMKSSIKPYWQGELMQEFPDGS